MANSLIELNNILPSSILNLKKKRKFNNLVLFIDSENPYLPVVMDHNTIYFIDVRKEISFFFIFTIFI